MGEYWVSKKQYWCKYCNIWVRDDAPSRRLHETGLKHQGSKERFIRDLYKGGERAKRDKATEAAEIARIEAAAKGAFAKDIGAKPPPKAPDRRVAPASAALRKKPTGDKWSNYSNAAQLGFDDEETKMSSYEIEQMVRGRDTKVGGWEEVTTPVIVYGVDGVPVPQHGEGSGSAGAAAPAYEDDHDNFKIQQGTKRPVRDVYDDDEFDPQALLGGLKFKSKERKIGEAEPEAPKEEAKEEGKPESGGKGWAKISINPNDSNVKCELEVSDELEAVTAAHAESSDANGLDDAKPEIKPTMTVIPEPSPVPAAASAEAGSSSGGSSMFKKRRPPPSSRKK